MESNSAYIYIYIINYTSHIYWCVNICMGHSICSQPLGSAIAIYGAWLVPPPPQLGDVGASWPKGRITCWVPAGQIRANKVWKLTLLRRHLSSTGGNSGSLGWPQPWPVVATTWATTHVWWASTPCKKLAMVMKLDTDLPYILCSSWLASLMLWLWWGPRAA